ncbi:RNA 2',3'-cyclic phosphodiesterase [Pusillimonas sp. DMV24BSW_D]|uniref:RNA 2',3'-cyclic phosphodiesterase n=1 Tax=Neopusillimonas aestuarii TaxID=2716226 RepID=UPI001409D42E|nr:RNA 2',3'-cyclic phosphodiesterase [Pusillimonas sp. DMV24BSW_D]QIM49495.1 RNA 2',3'-cyclic phosphodiesterase [Pusillimonas sp. DMV24BSW_D]
MSILSDPIPVPSADAASQPSRLFYALWPDAETAGRLAKLQENLAGRHTHPNDMHLTLAFLGIQPEENQPVLHAILRDLPLPEAFSLDLTELNSFPNIKVSWVGPKITPQPLDQLWRMLGNSLDKHEIWWDKKIPFRPHVTLARKVVAPHSLLREPVCWQARRVVLAGSVPCAVPGGGGKYRVLAERRLF